MLPCRSGRLSAGVLALVALACPSPVGGQTLGLIDNISFGITDVVTNPPGGTLQMGTNGNITYGSNLLGTGLGIAGKVQLSGTTGQTVELRCSSNATLTKVAGGSITLTPVIISFGTPQTYAAATPCGGTAVTVLTETLSATASLNIAYLAGQLDIGASSVQGNFASTNASGVPVTLTVIFI